MALPTTFLGMFDDRVEAYPWATPIDAEYLKRVCVRHLFFGGHLAINDGYISRSRVLRSAIMAREDSNPFNAMLRTGIIRVVAPDRDFVSSVMRRIESGVDGFAALKKNDAEWRTLKLRLEVLSEAAEKNKSYIPWPKPHMGLGFLRMFRRCAYRPVGELGLRHVPQPEFNRFCDRFIRLATANPDAIRTTYETTAKALVADSGYVTEPEAAMRELMGIANEAYHFNFAACLSAEQDGNFGVETNQSQAFDEMLEISNVDVETMRQMPSFSLPRTKILLDGDKVRGAFEYRDSPVYIWKERYMAAVDQYVQLKIGRDDLQSVQETYLEEIVKHFGAIYRSMKVDKVMSWLLVPATAATSFAPIESQLLSYGVSTVAGGIALAAENFISPHILKRINVEVRTRRELKLLADDATKAAIRQAGARQAICSALVDHDRALELTDGLPTFEPQERRP